MAFRSDPTEPAPQRGEGDDGVVMIFVALSLIAILAVAALVLDGGQTYNQHRDAQNASDAAAMAGTRALDRTLFNSGTGALPNNCTPNGAHTAIYNSAACIGLVNDAALVTCTLIDGTLNDLASCDAGTIPPTAQGVRVTTTSTKNTNFGKVGANIATTTASVTSAALLQPIKTGKAPWVICSAPGGGGEYDFLTNGVADKAKLQAAGSFTLQSSQLYGSDSVCRGDAAQFKGKIQDSDTLVVGQPSSVRVENGNGNVGDVSGFYLPCPGSTLNDCMLLPISDHTTGNGSDGTVYVVAWAYFHVSVTNGNPKASASFASLLSGVAPDGTETGTGPLTGAAAHIATLVE